MLNPILIHKRNLRIALAGVVTQILLSALMILLGRWSGTTGVQAAGILGMTGVVAWTWLALHQYIKATFAEQGTAESKIEPVKAVLSSEESRVDAAVENEKADVSPPEAVASPPKIIGTQAALILSQRFVSPLLSLLIASFLCWFGIALFENEWRASGSNRFLHVDPLQALALMAGWCIVAFGVTRFFLFLCRRSAAIHEHAPGIKFMVGVLWAGVLFLIGFTAVHFGYGSPLRYISLAVPTAMAVVGAEIVIFLFLDRFRPRRRGEEPRPAFDSRLLGLLLHSEGMRRTLWETLDYQFGFEVSKSWFLRLCARSLWTWVFLAVGTLLFFSAIVIVEPHQQSLLFRFGKLQGAPLEPGLHWKAPWPIDSAALYDVTGVRRIHLGSHRPELPGGEVYVANVPILWNNLHGVTAEEFLVVAPSADSLEVIAPTRGNTADSAHTDNTKPPSVNLMGGDIFVEYCISDLRAFALSSNNTEILFAQIAEAEASRELFRYDIDTLLGNGRIEAEDRLLRRLRDVPAAHALGIEVLKVGFAGTHPPMEVAEAFHETIIARQERLAAIQDAESYATRVKIEAAGTLKQADKLVQGIDTIEKVENAGDRREFALSRDQAEILLSAAGGRVAEAMADARGYRWQRENDERGKSERFLREIELFRIGPVMFPRWQYLSVLERGLAQAKKYVLLAEREKLVLRFNFLNPSTAMQDATNASRRMPIPPVLEDSGTEESQEKTFGQNRDK